MIETAYAAIAAIATSVFVAFPSLSPQVDASAPVVGAKGDRADIRPLGTRRARSACSAARCSYVFRGPHCRSGFASLAQGQWLRISAEGGSPCLPPKTYFAHHGELPRGRTGSSP